MAAMKTAGFNWVLDFLKYWSVKYLSIAKIIMIVAGMR